ncbi:MAG: sulfotransferase [Planctomycetota bacterium]
MRQFNKLFVIALPRCATVSMCDALGELGIRTAHLGRIYGEASNEHNNPARLKRMHEQISQGDFALEILDECRGLADYPACSFEVFSQLDKQYPDSLFVNVRRDQDKQRWIQSVERQFVGLQLLKAGRQSTEEEQRFMQVMLSFREMTFGQAKFDADAYLAAYDRYQRQVVEYFTGRERQLLNMESIQTLETSGFSELCQFLHLDSLDKPFPRSNAHSELPTKLFMQALEEEHITSQTGIKPVGC